MMLTTIIIYLHLPRLIQFLQQPTHVRYPLRIEFVNLLRVDRYTYTTRFRMDAEWGFEYMVTVFRDFGVDSRVGILENYVF